jgi:hypothetical protein
MEDRTTCSFVRTNGWLSHQWRCILIASRQVSNSAVRIMMGNLNSGQSCSETGETHERGHQRLRDK